MHTRTDRCTHIYIYIYICTYVCICMCICIHSKHRYMFVHRCRYVLKTCAQFTCVCLCAYSCTQFLLTYLVSYLNVHDAQTHRERERESERERETDIFLYVYTYVYTCIYIHTHTMFQTHTSMCIPSAATPSSCNCSSPCFRRRVPRLLLGQAEAEVPAAAKARGSVSAEISCAEVWSGLLATFAVWLQ